MVDKMNPKSIYYIQKLHLMQHPHECGYFRETYRSSIVVYTNSDPNSGSTCLNNNNNARSTCTIIYFLLDGFQISPFHKVKNDEIWNFYTGSSVNIFMIDNDGNLLKIILGDDLDNNEYLQYVIAGNTWFAVELTNKNSYSLMNCIVSPGFDYGDFELGKKNDLLNKFPQHSKLITRMTLE